MKSLRIVVIASLAFVVSTSVYGQVNFGIIGGVNFADLNGRIDGIKDSDTKVKRGFNIGGVANFSFTDILSLQTGLILNSKGYEYRLDNNGDFDSKADYGKLVTNLMYLDIPMNLRAQFDLGNTVVYGQFGPYLGIALSGKTKATGDFKKDLEELEIDTEETIEFGGSAASDDLKRIDFGLTLGLGVGIEDFEIGAAYDFGLMNILPGGDSDNYIRNGVFKVSVAYMFKE